MVRWRRVQPCILHAHGHFATVIHHPAPSSISAPHCPRQLQLEASRFKEILRNFIFLFLSQKTHMEIFDVRVSIGFLHSRRSPVKETCIRMLTAFLKTVSKSCIEQSPTGDQLSGAEPIHVSRPLWTVFFRLFCRWVILSYSVFFRCPFPLPLKIFTHILFKYITTPLLPTVCTLVYLSLAVPGLCCCTRARL